MMQKDFEKALKENKMFYMRKYRYFGMYGNAKLVNAETARKKSAVRVAGGWCPYSFELAN